MKNAPVGARLNFLVKKTTFLQFFVFWIIFLTLWGDTCCFKSDFRVVLRICEISKLSKNLFLELIFQGIGPKPIQTPLRQRPNHDNFPGFRGGGLRNFHIGIYTYAPDTDWKSGFPRFQMTS